MISSKFLKNSVPREYHFRDSNTYNILNDWKMYISYNISHICDSMYNRFDLVWIYIMYVGYIDDECSTI